MLHQRVQTAPSPPQIEPHHKKEKFRVLARGYATGPMPLRMLPCTAMYKLFSYHVIISVLLYHRIVTSLHTEP